MLPTLTAEGCRARRARLWQSLPERPDWILISEPRHLAYLCGYWTSPFVFRATNSGAVLVLGGDGTSILVADNMLAAFTGQAHVDEVYAPVWYHGRQTAPYRKGMLVESVLARMAGLDGTHLGLESASLPDGIVRGLEGSRGRLRVTPVDAALHELARAKDRDELELMRCSIRLGEAGMAAGLAGIRPGMTELEAYQLVVAAVLAAAGEQVHLYGDFVSGPRTERVGGPPSLRMIEKGDLVILDFSVIVGGYRGDFANTFVCGAKPSERQRQLAEACLDALAAAEAQVRAGVAARQVDRAVRESFDAKHLGDNFRSHSGHGIGLGHPDPPFLVPESSDELRSGDVIAIEPGQYLADFGGMRFEHNYLVTESGCQRLSNHALTLEQPG